MKLVMIHKKVKFKGEVYWLHGNINGGYNLSPLEHYDNLGDLIVNPFTEISFAIVVGGEIQQYGEVIGYENELEEVK
jgi:hypothetical protein